MGDSLFHLDDLLVIINGQKFFWQTLQPYFELELLLKKLFMLCSPSARIKK